MTDDRPPTPTLCGVVVVGGTGIEWVCVRETHTTAADLRDRGPLDSRGRPWQADRHYFRRRYPNRDTSPTSDTIPPERVTRE